MTRCCKRVPRNHIHPGFRMLINPCRHTIEAALADCPNHDFVVAENRGDHVHISFDPYKDAGDRSVYREKCHSLWEWAALATKAIHPRRKIYGGYPIPGSSALYFSIGGLCSDAYEEYAHAIVLLWDGSSRMIDEFDRPQ